MQKKLHLDLLNAARKEDEEKIKPLVLQKPRNIL